MISSARALNLDAAAMPALVGILGGLGQPLWNAPAPNGWADRAADWAAPEAMMRRVDWAYGFSGRIGDNDPVELADAVLGPLLHDQTLMAMRHAGSRRDAMTLLLTSPNSKGADDDEARTSIRAAGPGLGSEPVRYGRTRLAGAGRGADRATLRGGDPARRDGRAGGGGAVRRSGAARPARRN